ncbi:MAG TPA: hypothetical protein VN519_06480 [Bryobacteraceae bacterium]|nr:hypothetical protein [Bryobacteraceae bacterium]
MSVPQIRQFPELSQSENEAVWVLWLHGLYGPADLECDADMVRQRRDYREDDVEFIGGSKSGRVSDPKAACEYGFIPVGTPEFADLMP